MGTLQKMKHKGCIFWIFTFAIFTFAIVIRCLYLLGRNMGPPTYEKDARRALEEAGCPNSWIADLESQRPLDSNTFTYFLTFPNVAVVCLLACNTNLTENERMRIYSKGIQEANYHIEHSLRGNENDLRRYILETNHAKVKESNIRLISAAVLVLALFALAPIVKKLLFGHKRV